MAPKPPATEELQEALDLVTKHGSGHTAAKFCDVPSGTLTHRAGMAMKMGMEPTTKPAVYGPDDVPEGHKVKGESTLYDADGNIKQKWVKTQEDLERFEDKAKGFVEGFIEKVPQYKPRPVQGNGKAGGRARGESAFKELVNIIVWGDPHCGMYSWADETGADFDVNIFQQDLCNATQYLVNEAPKAGTCLIVNLVDFFHADTPEGTRGTRLDMDTRIAEVIRVGVIAFRKCVDVALSRHEKVEIVNCIGNHDETLSLALSIMLSHIYEDEPRVVVHDAPTFRHYLRYGKVLIGVTHGDKRSASKDANLPQIMATERPEDWGQTKFRYFYKGHLHHDRLTEFNGCIVEQFRTLAPGDVYAVSNGWLSGQSMKLITMHKEYGEVKRNTCNINLLRDLGHASTTKKN